jgi:hypothetical protein
MANASPFQNFAPGFDFLQGLVQNAGSAMPGIGQWVAPTLDPQELEKRIQELRTVQFWLEQNVRMLSTTVQALEVQKMTLSTLRTMNVQMGDLREALTPKPAEPAPAPDEITAEAQDKPTAPVDPMQWWNALTQQFGEIAANAIKDNPSAAAFATNAAAASPARAGKPAAAKTTPAARKRPVKRAAKAAPTSKPASR